MLGTRYVLLAGVAALGLAATLPARSGGDCCASKTDAAKVQPAAVKTASGGTCTVAPAAPAAFAVRSQAALTQAAKENRLVMVAVYNANATGVKACPTTAAKVAQAGDKACLITAAKVAQAGEKVCPTTAANVTQAADKTSACGEKDGAAIQAAQKRFVSLQVNPNDCPGSKAFAAKHNVKTYPTTLFLDAKGKEVHRVAGELEPAKLVAAMDAALAKAGTTVASRG